MDLTPKVLKTPDGNLVRCLYVANISVMTHFQDLHDLFNKYGTIKQLYFKKNDNTKRNTYAFITYATPEEAVMAYMDRNTMKLNCKKLHISVADFWHQPIVEPDGSIIYDPRSKKIFNISTQMDGETTSGEDNANNEVEVDESSKQDCPIARLNDDCLLHVFELIPFSHRHTLSQVCRRWRNIMSMFWARFTELNFNEEPFNELDDCAHKRLALYLRLCPNIKSVHLANKDPTGGLFSKIVLTDGEELKFDSLSIMTIAGLCPDLEELSLFGIELNQRPLASIAHSCRNLKRLTVKNCRFISLDHEMNSILRKCSKLENLKVANCVLKPGYWLRNLKPALKTLSLLCCDINLSFLYQGLDNLKDSLEELELIIDECSYPIDFQKLHGFRKLESIVYINSSLHLQKSSVNMFCQLKRLHLECNTFVTNSILKGIVQNSPNLTSLNLGKSKNALLTPEGFLELTKLSELTNLNLSVNHINDELLEGLADKLKKLTVLSLNSCEEISDRGCKRIIQSMMNLKELHVDSCSKVTNKTVQAAVESFNLYPEKEKLIIHGADSGITEVQKNPHPKIELVLISREPYSWYFTDKFREFSEFYDDEDFDEDDYDFDVYDEEEFFDFPSDSDDIDLLNNLNPFNVYLNFI